jgi:hypothetical protein
MQSFKDMLGDAIGCFQLCLCSGEGQKKWFLKAAEWFNEKKGEWVFWLENICEDLRLDPRYLRKDDVLAAQMSYDMVKLKTMRRIAR